jgi:hypothetical protein
MAAMTGTGDGIVFVVTENNLREGGRHRDPLEAYLNVDNEKAAYLGEHPLRCVTDDGETFDARATGTHFKNFRSMPATAFGRWLKARCRVLPGDEVHARWQGGGAGAPEGVLRLTYVRKYAVPEKDGASVQSRRLERETEEALVAQLAEAGVPVQRQVRVATGVIDVLTPDAIYEVKTFLTRDSMFEGVGQLMVYQAGRGGGPPLRLVLVGRETRETAALIPVLARIGVEVDAWRD